MKSTSTNTGAVPAATSATSPSGPSQEKMNAPAPAPAAAQDVKSVVQDNKIAPPQLEQLSTREKTACCYYCCSFLMQFITQLQKETPDYSLNVFKANHKPIIDKLYQEFDTLLKNSHMPISNYQQMIMKFIEIFDEGVGIKKNSHDVSANDKKRLEFIEKLNKTPDGQRFYRTIGYVVQQAHEWCTALGVHPPATTEKYAGMPINPYVADDKNKQGIFCSDKLKQLQTLAHDARAHKAELTPSPYK